MPNKEKIGAVAEITEHFANSSAAVITEYRGLSVKQVTALRRALGRDTTYAVVKNTLTRRAAADAGVAIDASLLVGPTAIAFVKGDAVEAAKGLRDFARTNPLLVIKGGILDGKVLSAAELGRIADLESREVLLAKLAGAIKALPTRAASLFQAPLTQMARLAKALEEQKAATAPAEAAAEAPAEAPAAAEVAVPAEVAADAVETAEAETPEAETSDAETPEAETPEAETPEAQTSEVETPEASTETSAEPAE